MNSRSHPRFGPLAIVAAAAALLASSCSAGSAVEAQAATPTATTLPAIITVAPSPAPPSTAPNSPAPNSTVTPTLAPLPTTEVPVAPTPPNPSAPAPQPVEMFSVPASEVHAPAKQLGSEVAQLLTTYDATMTAVDVAARVTVDAAEQADLVAAMAPLFHEGSESRGTIVYPQLGGMTETAASIMVVVRQEVGTGTAGEVMETRTLDVRLAKRAGEWRFAELASAGGTAIGRPADLPPAAAAVLDDPRIELPDSARWDIHRGHTSIALLELMAELADRTPFGVVVLSSGHPHNVFATDRTSNHTVGRAVDVYRLDERRVIDDRSENSLTHDTLRWLYGHGSVYKIGGPWSLDGTGGKSFSNVVHQDHIHIAVSR